MGDHSAPEASAKDRALAFAWKHRRKIASALIVALPLVSRFVPDFPTERVLSVVRLFLGA